MAYRLPQQWNNKVVGGMKVGISNEVQSLKGLIDHLA